VAAMLLVYVTSKKHSSIGDPTGRKSTGVRSIESGTINGKTEHTLNESNVR
jgi:hypothetical protein